MQLHVCACMRRYVRRLANEGRAARAFALEHAAPGRCVHSRIPWSPALLSPLAAWVSTSSAFRSAATPESARFASARSGTAARLHTRAHACHARVREHARAHAIAHFTNQGGRRARGVLATNSAPDSAARASAIWKRCATGIVSGSNKAHTRARRCARLLVRVRVRACACGCTCACMCGFEGERVRATARVSACARARPRMLACACACPRTSRGAGPARAAARTPRRTTLACASPQERARARERAGAPADACMARRAYGARPPEPRVWAAARSFTRARPRPRCGTRRAPCVCSASEHRRKKRRSGPGSVTHAPPAASENGASERASERATEGRQGGREWACITTLIMPRAWGRMPAASGASRALALARAAGQPGQRVIRGMRASSTRAWRAGRCPERGPARRA